MITYIVCFCTCCMYLFPSHIGSRGRPSLDVTREQLQLLLKQGFRAKAIARMLGCSTSYLYHKLHALGLRMRDRFTHIDDEDLEQCIRRLHQQYPKSGYEVCQGTYVRTALTFCSLVALHILHGYTLFYSTCIYSVPT